MLKTDHCLSYETCLEIHKHTHIEKERERERENFSKISYLQVGQSQTLSTYASHLIN